MPVKVLLSNKECLELLNYVQKTNIPIQYNYGQHRLNLLDETSNSFASLRLPIQTVFNRPYQHDNHVSDEMGYVIILIQSSHAAIGYFEDDLLIDHKVFSSYMVRQKQGTSQIKYLNTKGKSKAGSRVRLASMLSFFDDINARLKEIFDDHNVSRIALSCSKILLPHFYNAKTNRGFQKDDPRLYSIPLDIERPRFDTLLKTQEFLNQGEFTKDL